MVRDTLTLEPRGIAVASGLRPSFFAGLLLTTVWRPPGLSESEEGEKLTLPSIISRLTILLLHPHRRHLRRNHPLLRRRSLRCRRAMNRAEKQRMQWRSPENPPARLKRETDEMFFQQDRRTISAHCFLLKRLLWREHRKIVQTISAPHQEQRHAVNISRKVQASGREDSADSNGLFRQWKDTF